MWGLWKDPEEIGPQGNLCGDSLDITISFSLKIFEELISKKKLRPREFG